MIVRRACASLPKKQAIQTTQLPAQTGVWALNEQCALNAGSVFSVHYTTVADHAEGVSDIALEQYDALLNNGNNTINANDNGRELAAALAPVAKHARSQVARARAAAPVDDGNLNVNNNVNFRHGNFEFGPSTGVYVVGADNVLFEASAHGAFFGTYTPWAAGTNASEAIVGVNMTELASQLRADSAPGADCAPSLRALTDFVFTFDTGCRSVAVEIQSETCAPRFDRLDGALMVRRDVCGDGDAYGNIANAPVNAARSVSESSSSEEKYSRVVGAHDDDDDDDADRDVSHVYKFHKMPLEDRARAYRVSRREQRARRHEQADLPERGECGGLPCQISLAFRLASWRNGHHEGITSYHVSRRSQHSRRSSGWSSSRHESRHTDDDDDDDNDGKLYPYALRCAISRCFLDCVP
jgi:hypothetical protein